MAKRKTLPKDFEEIVSTGDVSAIKAVFAKCDINAYGGYNKGNALSFRLDDEMMKWCVEQGADIEYVDAYGYTPLLLHAGHSYAQTQALCLIEMGADITYKGSFPSRTVMDNAVSSGSIEVVKRLCENGIGEETCTRALENAMKGACPLDALKLTCVAQYLIGERKSPVTEQMKTLMKKIGEEIEFYRSSMDKDFAAQIDAALEILYPLFDTQPVPKRVLFDGKTKIKVKSHTWQKQHAELWQLLVPGSGKADTMQGEVIRISGKLSYEILDNGCMNWDGEYRKLANALSDFLRTGKRLKEKEYTELDVIFGKIKDANEKEMCRLTELCVSWVLNNPEPVPTGETTYRR